MDNYTNASDWQAEGGEAIAKLLGLRKNSEGRYDTDGGDKSALGLYLTVKRVIEEAKPGHTHKGFEARIYNFGHDRNGNRTAAWELFQDGRRISSSARRAQTGYSRLADEAVRRAIKRSHNVTPTPRMATCTETPELEVWITYNEGV